MTRVFRTRGTHGLTLIELLVVIAIIAILALMLFGQPQVSRELARRARCNSNLKQLGLAIAMYADKYQNRCPMDSANPTLVGSMKLLSNVCTSAKILHCPDDTRWGAKPENDFGKLTVKNISYSYVPNLIWQDYPDSILALDRIYSTSAGSAWPKRGNHKGQGGGNVLFNDGHVAWFNGLPSALKDTDGRQVVLSP
jgi:prepilin-type N-terminal cleavage/methylation domain-containing protein/prepilin-type processing-associated H-X9-DG protein